VQSFARHPYVEHITWAEPCRNSRQKARALRQSRRCDVSGVNGRGGCANR
jgi:hypothetical protein